MLKKVVLLFAVLIVFYGFSQDAPYSNLRIKKLNNNIRLNYTLVHMPTDQVAYQLKPTMGLIGFHYLIPINNWLYTGAAMHAAVIGDQGGLFTLGADLGINKKLYKNIYFDANVHFGGGGGYRTLVNGGGFLYPNIGLQYKTKQFSFGVQYGNVNFFTGIINNDNVSFFVEIPSLVRRTSYANTQKNFIVADNFTNDIWKKPAVKSVQQVTFDFMFPFGASRKDASRNFEPITNTLSLLGFEYQRYLLEDTFIYAHTDAMYNGLVSGFMDLFIGAGHNIHLTKNSQFFGKFGIGAAGGRIYPENGLTIYPSVGVDIKLSENFGFGGHAGYHRSIGGTFEAYTAGFSLKYYALSGGIKHPFTEEISPEIKAQGIQIEVQNQTYFNVAKFGIPNSNLQLIALKINYTLSKRIYIAGEASFAYEGKSGGYAHGIFGLGLKSNSFFNDHFSLFSELGIGVAGGGRVDAGNGVLLRAIAGINYQVSNDFGMHFSRGQIYSPFGKVNSTNFNIGLSYRLSILNTKK